MRPALLVDYRFYPPSPLIRRRFPADSIGGRISASVSLRGRVTSAVLVQAFSSTAQSLLSSCEVSPGPEPLITRLLP
jgi:hypothetical protein